MTVNTQTNHQRPVRIREMWRWGMVAILVAWLSASLLLDGVIMPGLYGAGMMDSTGFVIAGEMIFARFNHLELLAGAMVLSGCLMARAQGFSGIMGRSPRTVVAIATLLLAIPFVYTYALTPQMGALGFQNAWETAAVPDSMNQQLHGLYWSLELLKLAAAGFLLSHVQGPSEQSVA